MQVRPDDWRGYWTFDESDGPIADDVSGYLNNGDIDGAVLVQDGVGTSLLFNPQSENTVWVADSISLDQPHVTKQLTIEMWAKKSYNVTGTRHMLMKWGCYSLLISQNQKLNAGVWGKDITGNTVLANNVWYHLAVTYDGYYTRLYVNGVLDGEPVNNPGLIPEDTWPLQIGHTWYDAGAFPGYIDEVRVYDYALTQDRIGRHYADEWPPEKYDTNDGETIGAYVNGYTASSLSYDGSAWDGVYARWYHHFKMAGVGATRWKGNGNPCDRITSGSMDIKITNNPGGLIVVSSGSIPNYIGSIPESSGPTPDYAWGRAVISYAVDAVSIAFPPLAFAWTTSQLVFDLTSKYDGQIDTTTEQKRMWDYGWESDASQFLYFEVSAPNNVSWAFSTTYKMEYADGLPNNWWWRNVTLGPYVYNQDWIIPMRILDGKGLNGESWNPGMMTAEEKEKYGIEEIPIELLLKEEGGRFVLPREDLQQMLDSGESVVYFAHNLPINLVPLKIDADGDSGNITPAPTAVTIAVPVPTPETTTGTVTAPTPTPLYTPEPVKEPDQILVPAVTPTPTYVPSSAHSN